MPGEISINELKLLLNASKVILIDVRSTKEFNELHMPNAVNIPIEQIEKGLFQPNSGACLITICASGGGRSKKAAALLKKQFNNPVYSLIGGIFDWFNIETPQAKNREMTFL